MALRSAIHGELLRLQGNQRRFMRQHQSWGKQVQSVTFKGRVEPIRANTGRL